MIARLSAFLVWGLFACCSGYWLLQLLARPIATPAQALPVSDQAPLRSDLSRLLGVTPVNAEPQEEVPVQSRFELLGVVAPKSEAARRAGEGVALISVDGQPRTVRVGAPLDGALRLLAVSATEVTLGGEGMASVQLKMAPRSEPNTGSLPPAAPSPTILGGTPQMQQPGQQQPPVQPRPAPTEPSRDPRRPPPTQLVPTEFR